MFQKIPCRERLFLSFFSDRTYKPGSVRKMRGNHLSSLRVTAQFEHRSATMKTGRAAPRKNEIQGVASDRVYSAPMLPWGRVSSYLAFPPLPVLADRRYISVALSRESPPADVISYPAL